MDFDQRASRLERLASLLEKGAITDEEFTFEKQKLLNDEPANSVAKPNALASQGEAVGFLGGASESSSSATLMQRLGNHDGTEKMPINIEIAEKVFFVWAVLVAVYWGLSRPESAPQQAAIAAQALVLIAIPYCVIATFQRRQRRISAD